MMVQGNGEYAAAPSAEANSASENYPAKPQPEPADTPPRRLHDVCLELRDKVDAFLSQEPKTSLLRDTQSQVRESMAVVDEALTKYRPEQIALSYNGGKDCLVLLVVILACLARRDPAPGPEPNPNGSPASSPLPESLQAVYIRPPDPFPEVDAFVASSAAHYDLQVKQYTLAMRQGLESYLADCPGVRAIFVGTRRTDPHGEKLKHFDPTDKGWPNFMRIHPVIDWHYAEIWTVSLACPLNMVDDDYVARQKYDPEASILTSGALEQFIRHLGIPYCPLYDQGYTSLGGTRDTHPNPHLKKAGDKDDSFRPAYELIADDEERLGRDK